MILIKRIDYEILPDTETEFIDSEGENHKVGGRKYRRYDGADIMIAYSTPAARAIEATIHTINQKDKKIAELMLEIASMEQEIHQAEMAIEEVQTLSLWGMIKFALRG